MTDKSVSGRVRALVEPVLAAAGLELFDVEQNASVLKVTIDRPGGVDLEVVENASRLVSGELDRHDPVAGRYLLEVSSPGLERPLRTPVHFERAVGVDVALKLKPGALGGRRVEGILEAADDEGIVVAGNRVTYADIQSARTRFVWPAPKQKAATR